jgi:hypothetical protein
MPGRSRQPWKSWSPSGSGQSQAGPCTPLRPRASGLWTMALAPSRHISCHILMHIQERYENMTTARPIRRSLPFSHSCQLCLPWAYSGSSVSVSSVRFISPITHTLPVLALIFAVIVTGIAADNTFTTSTEFLDFDSFYFIFDAFALSVGGLTIFTLPVLCDFTHKHPNCYS